MRTNLLGFAKVIRVSNAVAAGTTAINTTEIDTQGFDSVTFLAALGAIVAGAATSIKVQGTDTSGSGYTDLTGTSVTIADTDDNKIAAVEVHRPVHRYLRLVMTRATQNSTLDGALALMHSARDLPITAHSTTVGNEIHLSPAAGTA